MHVISNKKTLVFTPENASEVTKYIPHAKVFEHNGQEMVAVPHGVEETLVLRNMGLQNPPAPIMTYYHWPARFKPMEHQKATSSFLTMNKQALCLNSPGTGKSISSLWAADYLLDMGVVNKVLIVAPLSVLTVVWGKELKHHMLHRKFVIVTGTPEKKRALLKEPADFMIINHDGFTNLAAHIDDVDLVIYDEATAVKNPSAARYRVFQKWINTHNPWLWLLTGTPISQSPVDAWTLAKLVQSPTVPKSYTAFKDLVMRKVSTFTWVPRDNAIELCKQVLQPSIRFSLDECIDLPETSYIGRETQLTHQQARAFTDMQKSAVAVFAQGDIIASNAAIVLSKLSQIACGAAYDSGGKTVTIPSQTRIDALKELIEEIGDKAIVFVPFRGVQDMLEQELVKAGYDVVSVHGDVSKTERNKIFDAFQNSDKIRVLLAHPKVAAHGLTLTRAPAIIWYAPIYSLEQYEQANARIKRLTTQGKTSIFHIYATSFERELYRRLQLKKKVLADFLDLVRGINDE